MSLPVLSTAAQRKQTQENLSVAAVAVHGAE